ncbi:MAG TPA: hypothetical protein PLP42_22305 [Acidobacteriota bacterium]|nr:hypothetical protein [Acidobacteriota bacterium]
MNQEDAEHLRVLSIFHYVVAGIAAVFACFPLLYLALGILMLSGALPSEDSGDETVTRVVGVFMIAFSGAFILIGLAFCTLLILTGRYLRRQVNYTFCLVMAAVACMFVPFGTVLGVFTILVLMRPSVKAAFGASATSDAG